MSDLLTIPDALHTPFKLLTSLAIGLLLGLQRERTPSAKAGLRTFALVAVFGTILGLIADATGNAWIVATGLALVGLSIVAAYHGEERPEEDSGTTTVIAALLCYALGVMVWYERTQLAVGTAIVATLLLHFKTELHGFTERLSRSDVASILQFAVVSFIILPLLPDRGFDAYGVLNPYRIWLMIVLISGVSLSGYLTLRLVGARQSLFMVGLSGGLVSSTATTLVFSRQARLQPEMLDVSGAIIAIANLMVLMRIMVIGAVVAPSALAQLLPVFGGALAFGLIALAYRLRPAIIRPEFRMPDLDNPTQLRVALGFGVLYALVLVGSAWLTNHVGSEGLYGLAVVSGLVDIDAITLSSLGLFGSGKIGPDVTVTTIGLAYLAAIVFKLGVVTLAGEVRLLRRWGVVLVAPGAALAAGLLLLGGK